MSMRSAYEGHANANDGQTSASILTLHRRFCELLCSVSISSFSVHTALPLRSQDQPNMPSLCISCKPLRPRSRSVSTQVLRFVVAMSSLESSLERICVNSRTNSAARKEAGSCGSYGQLSKPTATSRTLKTKCNPFGSRSRCGIACRTCMSCEHRFSRSDHLLSMVAR